MCVCSLSSVKINWISLCFGVLVRQKKTFEDFNLRFSILWGVSFFRHFKGETINRWIHRIISRLVQSHLSGVLLFLSLFEKSQSSWTLLQPSYTVSLPDKRSFLHKPVGVFRNVVGLYSLSMYNSRIYEVCIPPCSFITGKLCRVGFGNPFCVHPVR